MNNDDFQTEIARMIENIYLEGDDIFSAKERLNLTDQFKARARDKMNRELFYIVYQDQYYKNFHHALLLADSADQAIALAKNRIKNSVNSSFQALTELEFIAKFSTEPKLYKFFFEDRPGKTAYCKILAADETAAKKSFSNNFPGLIPEKIELVKKIFFLFAPDNINPTATQTETDKIAAAV